jgi:Predicted permeases
LAIPLLLHFVGLANLGGYSPDYIDHLVVGTTALAVGLNAFINAYIRWRRGNVALRERGLSSPGWAPWVASPALT